MLAVESNVICEAWVWKFGTRVAARSAIMWDSGVGNRERERETKIMRTLMVLGGATLLSFSKNPTHAHFLASYIQFYHVKTDRALES